MSNDIKLTLTLYKAYIKSVKIDMLIKGLTIFKDLYSNDEIKEMTIRLNKLTKQGK